MARALKVCPVPGCPNLTKSGRCEQHRRESDRARGTATQRGYTSPGHQEFRRLVLERDPLCVLCLLEDITRLSTVADHYPLSRRELTDRGLDPNDPAAGRGLCKPHHDRETARSQPGGWHGAHPGG